MMAMTSRRMWLSCPLMGLFEYVVQQAGLIWLAPKIISQQNKLSDFDFEWLVRLL
jgi:hypothetical protein